MGAKRVCAMVITCICAFLGIGSLIGGVIYLGNPESLEKGSCYVFDVETGTRTCKGNAEEYTYFATSEYCGVNVILESDPDDASCVSIDDRKDVDKEYDCYFEENSCDDQIFSFESASDRRTEAIIMIVVSAVWSVCCCMVWICAYRDRFVEI